MNKTAIKNFAVWARKKLISESIYKAGHVGITEKEIFAPLPQSKTDIQFFDIGTGEIVKVKGSDISKRNALVNKINEKAKETDYKNAFEFVMEEVAYTWFNRLIAIRFMEVNEYLPSDIRVLSSKTKGKNEPDIVTKAMEIVDSEQWAVDSEYILKCKMDNKLDELFRYMFIKQCNELNKVLPNLFEQTNNYTELLLSISFTDTDGVLRHLVNDISEEDFGEAVEIIGWLYQYYNTEPKDKVFVNLKKNIKISKENIPAATQLFTPDWIVRYMVENSLGRIAVEKLSLDPKAMGWKYYLEEAEQTDELKNQLAIINGDKKDFKLEELKVIDPCMGSGHILVYAFDVLMQIYESQGYTSRDAVASIMENNLFGLDIDERAYQLSYFALMMKARANDRGFLTREIAPQVYCPKGYADGEEYGSLLNVDELKVMPEGLGTNEQASLFDKNYETSINAWNFCRLLNQKYDVVVTNPPYMGSKGMSAKLSKYVQDNYADSKSDMFAVFIERTLEMAKENGYSAMITQHAFMFLSSYEKLRAKLMHTNFVNMAHLGARAFEEIGGEVVQTTSWVMRKSYLKGYKGTYARLVDFNSQQEKENEFLTHNHLHTATQENFSKIPGSPIAYWVSEKMLSAFENVGNLGDIAYPKTGMTTGDNNRFLRFWSEIEIYKANFNSKSSDDAKNSLAKWFPYCKGGGFKRWYGFNEYLVNWENDGFEIKNNIKDNGLKAASVRSESLYFKELITWSAVTSGKFSCRIVEGGYLFDSGGSSISVSFDKLYLLALLNSAVGQYCLDISNATINYQPGDIAGIPVIKEEKEQVENLVQQNISISKTDWDSFETSWDFVRHPFIQSLEHYEVFDPDTNAKLTSLEECYRIWSMFSEERFNTLKQNEEELNRIFIDIYGLQDELTPEVEDKDVTVRFADKTRDVKLFISYAVGCMFGRYSLDVDGLAYAGGEFDNNKYTSFIPDDDNVIPITDEEYFGDDIIGRFTEFVKTVYGEETLEDNLDFIASALTNKGNTSREVIRNYFLKDFYKDHVKTYQKRPIYWLYDSGKQDGFKALVYMHRYNADTTGLLRVDYLHKIQRTYENEIEHMKDNIDNNHDVAKSTKRMEKLVKQLQEARDYDEKIAYLALSRIEIDLDDGVKVNYEKVQTGQDGKKLDVLGKI